MKLEDYQRWLVDEQWNGYKLDEILADTVPLRPSDEYVDLLNYSGALRSLSIIMAGLCGEAGEASEHFKKWIRDGAINKYEAGIELGDTLAYLTWLAASLGYTLEDLATMNHAKLTARGRKT